MRTKIFFQLNVCAVALFITARSIAQDTGNPKVANNLYATIASVENSPEGAAYGSASATVSDKIARSFTRYFGDAEQNWSMLGKNFLNRFRLNGLLTNTLFDKYGKLIYTISYGTEKDMPADIRKMVRSVYYDYSISMAVKVQQDERDIWVVTLDNINEEIKVRVEEDQMEQVHQFYKSK